jgi:protein involved in polysaccharide export with SLBB domain
MIHRTMTRPARRLTAPRALFVALLLATAQGLPAQTGTGTGSGGNITREQLREELREHEAAAESSEYSRSLRQQAQLEAAVIRKRLDEGDFQVGDRITVTIVGHADLSDTYTVGSGPALVIPDVGEIPVGGVLRSEIQAHLQTELGRYLRDPVVRTEPLIRVAIMGAVGSPGFYNLPSTALLSDAIMEAGGPSANAKLDRLRIERRGETLWEDDVIRDALASGRTLDQLSLQAGDRIQLPSEGNQFWVAVRTWLPVATALTYLFIRVF